MKISDGFSRILNITSKDSLFELHISNYFRRDLYRYQEFAYLRADLFRVE